MSLRHHLPYVLLLLSVACGGAASHDTFGAGTYTGTLAYTSGSLPACADAQADAVANGNQPNQVCCASSIVPSFVVAPGAATVNGVKPDEADANLRWSEALEAWSLQGSGYGCNYIKYAEGALDANDTLTFNVKVIYQCDGNVVVDQNTRCSYSGVVTPGI